MRISIRVKTNARRNEVTKLEDGKFLVRVTVPPVDGKANEKIIEVLAEYFGKPKRCVAILRGETSKEKIIEVDES